MTATVTATYLRPNGEPCTGRVVFRLVAATYQDGLAAIFPTVPQSAVLTNAGTIEVELEPTSGDDAAFDATDMTYQVVERIDGAERDAYYVDIPSETSVDLGTLATYDDPLRVARVLVTPDISSLGYVTTDDLDAVTDAAGVRYPEADLSFTSSAQPAMPLSVGVDGYVYGAASTSSLVIVRSSDQFGTTETGYDLSAAGATGTIVYVGKVTEGYVAITSDAVAKAWRSNSFASGWSLVATFSKPVATFTVSRPYYLSGTGTIISAGEYKIDDTDAKLWVTTNGGTSWANKRTHVKAQAVTNNHYHGSGYDPVSGRIYAAAGDGANAWFGYSEDLGANWTSLPALGEPPESDTLYMQPVLVAPLPANIATTPDATGQSGIVSLSRDTGYLSPALVTVELGGYKQYGQAPYAYDGDSEAYVLIPQSGNFPESDTTFIAGTGDGGRSWHTVYSAAEVDADDYTKGMVGPDGDGKIMYSAIISGTRTLFVADPVTWAAPQPAAPTVQLDASANLIGALQAAGILKAGDGTAVTLVDGTLTAPTIDGDTVVTGDWVINGNTVLTELNGSIAGNPNFTEAVALGAGGTLHGSFGGNPTLTGVVVIQGSPTIGTDAAGTMALNVKAAAGVTRGINLMTGSTNRWLIRATADAESGSNAGSNFEIVARADDGSSLGTVLLVTRTDQGIVVGKAACKVGFYGFAGATKQTVSGSRGGNAALASLITALAASGLITDSTSA